DRDDGRRAGEQQIAAEDAEGAAGAELQRVEVQRPGLVEPRGRADGGAVVDADREGAGRIGGDADRKPSAADGVFNRQLPLGLLEPDLGRRSEVLALEAD